MKNINQKGFTLIEMILYLAIVSGFLVALVSFAWNIIYSREKSNQNQIVELSSRIAMAKIAYEIGNAKNIVSLSPSQIVLDNNGSNTTISLLSGKIQMTSALGGPYDLTSNQVTVTSLVFTDTASTDKNSKGIKVDLSTRQSSSILAGQTLAQNTLSQAVELKGQYNHGRSLLIDSSSVALTNTNSRLGGIILSNSSAANIVIDKMTISWTGVVGSVAQSILINGNTVWSGTGNSGTLLDLTNTTITPTDAFPLIINFSQPMAGSVIDLLLTMGDGSTSQVSLTFGTSPTNTPTPTPTPANCTQYCQQKYGTTGTCRKSSNCSGHNEGRIYECSSPNICCCR